MTGRHRPAAAATLVALLLAACAGCAGGGRPGDGATAGRLQAEGVTVVLTWQAAAASGERRLAATLTPDAAGFHLYGQSVPAQGVGGVGRPTRLDLGDGFSAEGPVTADRAEQPEPLAAGQSVPVYPAGPVTLSVPVRVAAGHALRVWMSYAACNDSVCLTPVMHRAVDVAPPPGA